MVVFWSSEDIQIINMFFSAILFSIWHILFFVIIFSTIRVINKNNFTVMILNGLFVLVYLGSLVSGSILFIYNVFENTPKILNDLITFFQCESTMFSYITKEVFNVGTINMFELYNENSLQLYYLISGGFNYNYSVIFNQDIDSFTSSHVSLLNQYNVNIFMKIINLQIILLSLSFISIFVRFSIKRNIKDNNSIKY